MLPTSHSSFIDKYLTVKRVDELVELQVLTHMNESLRETEQAYSRAKTDPISLAGAFSEFIATSSRLESSYRALQREIHRLDGELTARNADLRASLRQNEGMRLTLQQIIDTMPCGVVVIECDGMISHINPELKRLLDLTDEKIFLNTEILSTRSGIPISAIIDPAVEETDQEITPRSGMSDRWFAFSTRRLCPFDNQGQQTLLILRDITARKQAEREKDSNRNSKALAEVATILAHEVRNPLASLELFAELLESTPESQQRWISNIRAGIRTLSATVNNVLAFHGSESLKLTPIPLAALIVESIQLMQPIAHQADIEMRWTLDGVDPIVSVHRSGFQQVMVNLISNAIRHTSAGGKIEIVLRNGNEQTIIECIDNGGGILPHQIEHVFEAGFSGRGDSCGLGLAVCARIIHQHRGRISVTNRSPSGASFRIELPSFIQKEMRA
jgi:two-component system sensor histidine kinase FlrB